jgi:urocanate hydratase
MFKHLDYTKTIISLQVFVTSGLGGMSGAQPKAASICGCVGVVAEVRTSICVFTFRN